MQQLIDVTVIDLVGKRYRWIVVYNFLSIHFNLRYFIYLPVDEFLSILSITTCFKNAFWLEREVWDMFGLFFLNHFGLRRILTEYGFKGHPLRKDFPLTGYYETGFFESYKRLLKSKVSLAQEYRIYLFKNVWNKNYMGLHQKFQKKDLLLNL
jgi:NADH-quinone oxidoreductase subunit C